MKFTGVQYQKIFNSNIAFLKPILGDDSPILFLANAPVHGGLATPYHDVELNFFRRILQYLTQLKTIFSFLESYLGRLSLVIESLRLLELDVPVTISSRNECDAQIQASEVRAVQVRPAQVRMSVIQPPRSRQYRVIIGAFTSIYSIFSYFQDVYS